MLFNSQVFLLAFLPLALALFYLASANERIRVWLLIAASLVFYGYWEARLLPLLAGSVCANWLLAVAFAKSGRKWIVPAAIVLNLLLIGIFKYANFFADSLFFLLGQQRTDWNIILPLGISFFTFQQLSYLADLRRGDAPVYPFHEYALFVTFFPQLIAGPIVRHNEIIGQFALDPLRAGLGERFSRGAVLFVVGLFKKVVIADNLAATASPIFAAASNGDALAIDQAWLGALAYTFQLFFDFAGYSDMAIGLGLMFGFRLPINFDAPYTATSIREFWRRWHITLSRFLRDYLYIPQGGGRQSTVGQARALIVTMLLGGLWHGAGWTFVTWGGMHGAALAVNHAWQRVGRPLPVPLAWLLTFLFVVLGWVLFRAEDFGAARTMIAAMMGAAGGSLHGYGLSDLQYLLAAAAMAFFGPSSFRLVVEQLQPRRLLAAAAGLAFAFMVIHIGDDGYTEFIYFQF
jgi:D-alanyl-lipoteichoic acid acyltransferase DltB (MBOAT superfamily)